MIEIFKIQTIRMEHASVNEFYMLSRICIDEVHEKVLVINYIDTIKIKNSMV